MSGSAVQDIVCSDSSPNIYQTPGTNFSIPVIVCLDECDALLVFANGDQQKPCS
jgi:hypothetical protein